MKNENQIIKNQLFNNIYYNMIIQFKTLNIRNNYNSNINKIIN